jgi:mannose-1-phosphate guanylyltransferase
MVRVNHRLWSVVLAGGEGERTRPFIERWLGHPQPKQYCAFSGSRTLFQHTIDRADALSTPEQRVVIAANGHRSYVTDQLRGRGQGRVLFQPSNRGTAAGVYLALTHVLFEDPEAIVVIYPSDHFIYPESAFFETVNRAVQACEQVDEAVLLGVTPDTAESDFGWIVPAAGGPVSPLIRPVRRFAEKPTRRVAARVRAAGGLWNTFILASKVKTLWCLGWSRVPEMMTHFVDIWDALRTSSGSVPLERVYQDLPLRDFSTHILQRAVRSLAVLEMENVYWSDWGRPERILETLRLMGKQPSFSEELVFGGSRAGNAILC